MRIISGGQTGVDRAALDVAIELGLEWGGWAPKGWKAEDGVIPHRYRATGRNDGNGLIEAGRAGYPYRTERNVGDAWNLLVLYRRRLEGGTRLTLDLASRLRPRMARLTCAYTPTGEFPGEIASIRDWLRGRDRVMIAGPRESKEPGIYAQTFYVLGEALGA